MYGTIARFRVKSGMEQQLQAYAQEEDQRVIPGLVATYIYQADADPHEYYMAVLFESKEQYVANAESPEQDAEYQRFRAMLADDPEWHDGEVVHANQRT